MANRAYAFDHDHDADDAELRSLLGGKGAGLVAMTRLGIPVPPGFTVPTTACLDYLDRGWTDELTGAVRQGIAGIEAAVGRRLGDPEAPLLVSVRSGAALSMPGMMDTVLNAGMTEAVARGLAARTGDETFAWDTYKRAIVSFAQIVLGADPKQLAELDASTSATTTATTAEASALAFGQAVAAAGFPVPGDPHEQIRASTEAVFSSWHSDRARAYREREGIDHGLGTAANVQAMVFGNMGETSGTGVAFSRNPSTGEAGLMGDFLLNAQGEDVVAGTHQTMPLRDLADRWPSIWNELQQVSDRLERSSADMVDLEFTVEDGRLWLLQTRVAKRSPAAVFRSAVEMADDDDFPVDRAEAVRRCAAHMDDPPRLPGSADDEADDVVIATGLAASPGRAIGVVSLDPDDAVAREEAGERVILVREETSPSDIHGMGASVGLMTTLGGMVSHAAVVARSWGLAAVVGCEGVDLRDGAIVTSEHRIEPGTTITVCGDTGRVLLGERRAGTEPLPQVETIRAWARELEATGPAVADASVGGVGGAGSAAATFDADDCLRVIALKGMAMADALTEPLGADEVAVAATMSELEAAELIADLKGGRYRVTPEGTERVASLYASEAHAQPACDGVLDHDFHGPNMLLKQVVTAWQMRTVDGEEVMNDHTDADYDAGVIARLRDEVHAGVEPILDTVGAALPRLERYRARLEASLEKLEGGDGRYMAHPMLDSYHTVWFELHEELIKLAGRDRKSETEAGRA